MMSSYSLSLCEADYIIYKLSSGQVPQAHAATLERRHSEAGSFSAWLQDEQETTLITDARCCVTAETHEEGWRRLTIMGVLPFEAHGMLVRVLTPLADAGISVLVCSAFSTDHVFIKNERLEEALKALQQAGLGVQETQI